MHKRPGRYHLALQASSRVQEVREFMRTSPACRTYWNWVGILGWIYFLHLLIYSFSYLKCAEHLLTTVNTTLSKSRFPLCWVKMKRNRKMKRNITLHLNKRLQWIYVHGAVGTDWSSHSPCCVGGLGGTGVSLCQQRCPYEPPGVHAPA